MEQKPTALFFDTSGLNWLADAEACDAIIKALRVSHFVMIPASSVQEITATKNQERRDLLFGLMDRLMKRGGIFRSTDWLLDTHVKQYFAYQQLYDWTLHVDERFRDLEQMISSKTFPHGEQRETTSTILDTVEHDFLATSRQSREEWLQRAGLKPRDPIPAFHELAPLLMMRGGPYFLVATEMITDIIGNTPSEEAVVEFIHRCPPFSTYLHMLAVVEYDRCLRHVPEPSTTGKAGLIDVTSAIYLPYC